MILDRCSEESSPILHPRYETIALIGRGGMAEVFLAVTVGAGGIAKLAVLKRIWPELASDPHFRAMFLDEAGLSVRMSHPNLVQTYEIIEEDGALAIAMEYLDGQPLGRVLNRLNGAQALSLPQRIRIVSKLLAGLDYTHELADYDGTPLSVVHRDVNPHNVFITYDGSVKLVDFGIAKSAADNHHTRPGMVKGKSSYMAPEQFLGQPADRRTDIFAVGVILWEMLAQRRFWNGIADHEIAAYLISTRSLPRLPAEIDVPVELEEICMRALSRDRDERYATAAEMEAELHRAVTSTPEASNRLLGKAVAEGFATERADRQSLIDRHLKKMRSGDHVFPTGNYAALRGYPTPSVSLPPIEIPPAAPSTRLLWVAIALTTVMSVLLVVAIFSARGTAGRGALPTFESSPATAAARQTGRSPAPAPARTERVDVAAASSGPVNPQDSTEGQRSRRAALARRNRGSTSSPHRGAAAAMPVAPAQSLAPPASGTDFGADRQPAYPRPRPIETRSPFLQQAQSRPRPIETASPFLLPDAPPPTSGKQAQ
ncbi:MAG TPA: serine/threonine-protein kinase [Polyangia bacterium]|nr:serine/threonine-protein kinase [Polyangia bacterium]